MHFDADEFDSQAFEPTAATEDQCWAAIPLLEGTLKARTLNHLGGLAFEREDFRKASMLADQAAIEWQTLGHDDEAAKCYSNAGSCLRNIGELEQALPLYLKAAEIASKAGDEEFLAITYIILGSIHNELYEIEKSLEYCLQAMHAADRAESIPEQITSLEGVGIAYLNTGLPEIAIDFLRKGFNIASKAGKIKAAANIRTLMASCHSMMNRPELAIDEIQAARELALLMNDHPLACERGNQMSGIHCTLGNYELAIEIAHEVKEVASRERLPKVAADASANIGHALNCLGQYESAYQLLTSAAEIMKMGGDFAEAILAEADAAHAALGMGNIALAQLRLAACERTAEKIDLLKCERIFNLNDPHSMLSLVHFQLELEIQLAAEKGKPFSLANENMEKLFGLESKAVNPENQTIVNAIVALKPEFIVSAAVPELTTPEGELLTKTLVELIDGKFFANDPEKLGRFHELQALVRKDKTEATENLFLAVTYYMDADSLDKAKEISTKLQFELAARAEISRARAINSRIY